MAQAHDDVRPGAGSAGPRAGVAGAQLRRPFSGWLVLADPDEYVDLKRLFPEVEVRVEPDTGGFFELLAASEPGLVVLISPPAEPGDLYRVAAWRAANPGPRAVLMSPHQSVAIRLHALELGFEDAVDLSSDPMEVVGRLSIAGRGGPDNGRPADWIPLGDGVELDRRARAIRRDGRLMSMRPRELALLEYLAMHPGRAFTRTELMNHVWHEPLGNERTVDVYVSWLRAKIETDPARPLHLLTVRGSGYLFDPPKPAFRAADVRAGFPVNVNEPPTSR
jgi:two-component system OmpR family response regulator